MCYIDIYDFSDPVLDASLIYEAWFFGDVEGYIFKDDPSVAEVWHDGKLVAKVYKDWKGIRNKENAACERRASS